MPKPPIRTFFAIELPAPTLKHIDKELDKLKLSIPQKIKWVTAGLMHITLIFIGDFNLDHQSSIQKDLQSRLSGYGEINLSFEKMRVFPNLKNPRVLWLGLDNHRQLIKLAQIINLITSNYGYPQEKRVFSPHLTLGRLRNNVSSRDRELIGQVIANYEFTKFNPFTIDRLSFIKSSLTPKGPVYSTLFEIPL